MISTSRVRSELIRKVWFLKVKVFLYKFGVSATLVCSSLIASLRICVFPPNKIDSKRGGLCSALRPRLDIPINYRGSLSLLEGSSVGIGQATVDAVTIIMRTSLVEYSTNT